MIKKIAVVGSFCFTALFAALSLMYFVGAFNSLWTGWWQNSIEYERRLTLFEALPKRLGGIVFLGDSITYEGPWSELFPQTQIHNFGVDGDTSAGLLERIEA